MGLLDTIGNLTGVNAIADQHPFGIGYAPINRQYATLDPNANAALDRINATASQSPNDIAAQRLQGVPATAGLLDTPDKMANAQQKLGGYGDDAAQAAIAKRSGRVYDANINNIKNQVNAGSWGESSNNLQQAGGDLTQTNAITQGAYSRMLQYDQDRRAARQSIINNVLGTAGMVGGYATGGMAGAQMGQSLGSNALGSGQQSSGMGMGR